MTALPSPTNEHTVQSPTHFQELLSADLARVSLLNFWAAWAEPCTHTNAAVKELARKYPEALVLDVEADAQSGEEIAESFEVGSVPTFVILRGHTLLARIEGADVARLSAELAAHLRKPTAALASTDRAPLAPPTEKEEFESAEELEKRLRGLMTMDRVVLFMKGMPDAPRCGFSRQTVALLREHSVPFKHFDILGDESVRSGLKVLNDWPTFPQLIVDGEFVGGLDVLREMVANGEFQQVAEQVKAS